MRKKEECNAVFYYYRSDNLASFALIDPMPLKSSCIIDHHITPARTVSSHYIKCFSCEKEGA